MKAHANGKAGVGPPCLKVKDSDVEDDNIQYYPPLEEGINEIYRCVDKQLSPGTEARYIVTEALGKVAAGILAERGFKIPS